MNARTPVGILATATKALAYRPEHLDEPRAQPDYLAMDDVADYSQTLPRAVPADPDDVFSQDEDYDSAMAARELLARCPTSTPNGKWFGIATDACAALLEIVSTIRGQDNFGQFSEVDVDKWAAICKRMGCRS